MAQPRYQMASHVTQIRTLAATWASSSSPPLSLSLPYGIRPSPPPKAKAYQTMVAAAGGGGGRAASPLEGQRRRPSEGVQLWSGGAALTPPGSRPRGAAGKAKIQPG